MIRMRILMGIFAVPLCILASQANAASGKGSMQAGIIDPTEMSEGEARRLCAQERQLVKCDIVFEKKKIKEDESLFTTSYSNDNFFAEESDSTTACSTPITNKREKMVPRERIELSASSLPMTRSTTELPRLII